MKFTYATGDRPLEGYTIKQGLGRGGFGEVYRAVSDGGKEVALKVIQRNLDIELRGVNHCLNLKHPNLMLLYDVKETEGGDHWVVMEYVAGQGLDQVIADHPQGMPADQVLSIATSAPAACAAWQIAGISGTSIDTEPGASVQTRRVFGLISSEMPAPAIGS